MSRPDNLNIEWGKSNGEGSPTLGCLVIIVLAVGLYYLWGSSGSISNSIDLEPIGNRQIYDKLEDLDKRVGRLEEYLGENEE